MKTGSARAGRILAPVVALVVATLGLLVISGPTAVAAPSAATQEPCGVVPVPGCESTTTESVTSTSTTVEATTSTAPRATTTTQRQTTTTTRKATTSAAPTTPTTIETITTVSNLLVPGDGTEGAESTTTTVATATTVSDDGPSDGTLIGLVIAGLLLIAVVVSLLTWRYWVATRPPLLEDPGPRPGGSTRPARAAPAR